MLPGAAKAMLGLSRRSGSLMMGSAAVADALRRGKVRLLVLALDAGAATERRFTYLSGSRGVPLVRAGTQAELGAALGTSPKAVCAVTSEELGLGLWRTLNGAPSGSQPQQGGADAGDRPAGADSSEG